MKGDFSRLTFEPGKHYSAVFKQQGRVLLDSDWNEQQEIFHHRLKNVTIDQYGRSVVPTNGDFQVDVVVGAAGPDLTIAPGRAYVEGNLVELEATALPITLPANDQVQVPALVVDARELEAGQWLEVAAEEAAAIPPVRTRITAVDAGARILTVDPPLDAFSAASRPVARRIVTYTTQPDLPGATLPTDDGRYLVYLDVWQRHVTVLEDPDLAEVALGGPDTTTRTRTLGQVKLTPVGAGSGCSDFPPGWTPDDLLTEPPPPPGRLSARAAGTANLENQHYRVEIHQPGDQDAATFKWSRDNGALAARILALGAQTITFGHVVRDEDRQFEPGQWVEVTDDDTMLAGRPGVLVQLTGVAEPELTVLAWPTTDGAPPILGTNPVIRAWSSQDELPITAGTFIELEDGVEIRFENGDFRTGDYWLIPARREVNNVLWPAEANGTPLPRTPRGIRHDFCALALLQRAAGTWSVLSDCRREVMSTFDLDAAKVDRAGDTMTGPLIIQAGLTVEESTAIQGGLSVGGNASMAQDLTVGGKLNVDQEATLRNSLTIQGPVTAEQTLQVNGDATVNGALTADSTLNVTGATDLGDTLNVANLTTLGDALNVTGAATVGQGLTVNQNGFDVTGDSRVDGDLEVTGKLTVGDLDVTGAITGLPSDVPEGAIIMFSGASIPTGWQLCDGTNGTPDLNGRFIVATGGGYSVNDTGGEEKVTLTVEEMPKHTHGYKDIYYSENGGQVDVPNGLGSNDTDHDNKGWEIDRTTAEAGADEAHENRPPYYALAFIMKMPATP